MAFTFDRARGVFYTHAAFSPFARVSVAVCGPAPHDCNGACGHFRLGEFPFDVVLAHHRESAQIVFRTRPAHRGEVRR